MTGNERERNGFLPGERQNRMFSLGPNTLKMVFTWLDQSFKCFWVPNWEAQTLFEMFSLGPNTWLDQFLFGGLNTI